MQIELCCTKFIDIFYFMDQSERANYADDNTPHAVDDDIDIVLQKLKSDYV